MTELEKQEILSIKSPRPPSREDRLEAALKIARGRLQWIMNPDHYEPDNYTQIACFQHRANEALEEIEKALNA